MNLSPKLNILPTPVIIGLTSHFKPFSRLLYAMHKHRAIGVHFNVQRISVENVRQFINNLSKARCLEF